MLNQLQISGKEQFMELGFQERQGSFIPIQVFPGVICCYMNNENLQGINLCMVAVTNFIVSSST